jgi:hypothetical protein
MRITPIVACLVAASALPAVAGDGAPPAPNAPPAQPPQGSALVPVEKFFKGKITKVDGKSIEIAYDFADAAQLDDFDLSIPFRAIKTIARTIEVGQLRITGTGCVRHKAVFDKTAGASATLTPLKNHDFGFAVTEEHESEVFTLYCLYDKYFGLGDKKTIAQNMIIKFIPRDPKANADGRQDWRYCGTHGQKPEIERGAQYKVEIERGDNQSRMVINDWKTGGKEWDRDLFTQMVSLYGYEADFKVDDLVIRGTLDAGWIERHHVDLSTWKPPAAPAPADPNAPAKPAPTSAAPELAARVRAKIDGWPAETKPAEMAALLRDAAVPEDLKSEAAQKAVAAGEKRLVPFLVDGLYANDEASRRLTYDVLSKLVGKSFGYRSDAPEDQRKKAIQAVNEYLKKHASEFQ